jgi:hypothetical protein
MSQHDPQALHHVYRNMLSDPSVVEITTQLLSLLLPFETWLGIITVTFDMQLIKPLKLSLYPKVLNHRGEASVDRLKEK